MGLFSYGIVSSVRQSHNPLDNMYNILADRAVHTKSGRQLALYEKVTLDGSSIEPCGERCDSASYGMAISALADSSGILDNCKAINIDKRYEGIANRMMPELQKAAILLARGFMAGAPIVVRFHNDGDGSAGGIALYRALEALGMKMFEGEQRSVSWRMNKGIAYTIESFYEDRMLFESYESAERPIVVITDFGTSPESEGAIKASNGVCDIIWLDHHVPYEGFDRGLVRSYINVCDFGGDSNFTAGLLTSIFAVIIGNVDVSDLREAALVSDYSSYANFSDQNAVKNAMILDYLTSSSSEMYSKPKNMDIVIKDSVKSEDVFRHASRQLDEALTEGLRNVRSYKNSGGVNVYVLDFGHVAKLSLDYPLPGRYSSKLQDKLESANHGKTITMVHYGSYISLRLSQDLHGSVNILDIIEKLRGATNGMVSGGGHKQAASIRTDRNQIEETIRLVLLELGVVQ